MNKNIRPVRLASIAHARSGDKGSSANIGVIAFTPDGYRLLQKHLTSGVVSRFFAFFGDTVVERFELDNLGALNFVLDRILSSGGTSGLRADAQGKALAQQLLELRLPIADLSQAELAACLDPRRQKAGPS